MKVIKQEHHRVFRNRTYEVPDEVVEELGGDIGLVDVLEGLDFPEWFDIEEFFVSEEEDWYDEVKGGVETEWKVGSE